MAFRVRRDKVRGGSGSTLRSSEGIAGSLIASSTTTFAASLQHQVPGSVITNTGTPSSFSAGITGYAPLIASNTSVFGPSSAHQLSPGFVNQQGQAFSASLALALVLPQLDQTASMSGPTVAELADTSYPKISNLGSAISPVLNLGLAPNAIASAAAVLEPSLGVLGTLIVQTAVTFSPTANLGLSPSSISSTANLLSPSFTQGLYPTLLGESSVSSPGVIFQLAPSSIELATQVFAFRPAWKISASVLDYSGLVNNPSLVLGLTPESINATAIVGEANVQSRYSVPLIASNVTTFAPLTYRIFAGEISTTVSADLAAITHVRWARATSAVRFLGSEER